jgi:hypothetical protein
MSGNPKNELYEALAAAGAKANDLARVTTGWKEPEVAEFAKSFARVSNAAAKFLAAPPSDPLKVDVVRTEFGTSAVENIVGAFRMIHFDRYEAFIQQIFFVPKGGSRTSGTPGSETLAVTYKPTVHDWRDRLGSMDAYKALEYATDLFLASELGLAPTPDLGSGAIAKPPAPREGEANAAILAKYKTDCDTWRAGWKGYVEKQGIQDATPELVGAVADAMVSLHATKKPRPITKDDRISCDLLHPFFMEIAGVRQAEGAILMRYQNQRVVGARGEALVQLNLEAGDSLNAWLKGRLEAYQQRRLTGLPERANEYFSQVGQSVLPGDDAQPADVRTGLMPALLGLVRRLLQFFDAADNKMMYADATPVLAAFKEFQIKADEAEANRAYDMPMRLRKEVLIATAILRHPTLVQALVARTQVRRAAAYQNVFEAVKEALGWDLPDIAHYQDLAYASEILIGAGQVDVGSPSGPWANVSEAADAAAAASRLRDQARSFAHAFQAAAGVDLAAPNVNLSVPTSLVRVPVVTAGGRNGARTADPIPRPSRFPSSAPTDGLSRRIR